MKTSINLSFRLILLLILSFILINCIYLVTPASELINVTDYIKQYNFPAIVQMYLKPLEELDQSEIEFINLLQGLPEDKQKDYAKDVYKNKSLTTELLEKIKQEKTAEKPVTIDDKIDKITQKPENPVDIYAVIANGTDDEILGGWGITSMLSFYKLLKDVGVSDDNITLFLYHPNHKDFIHTERYEKMMKYPGEQFVLIHFPSDKNQVEIDDEKVTLKKFLKAISDIPSDNNDLVYILYNSHGTKKGKVKFPGGYLTSTTLKREINKIDYGKLILMGNSCYSGALLKKLRGIEDYIAIASSPEDSLSAADTVPQYLIECFRREPSASISKLVNDANKELLKSETPQMVIFYSDKNLINEPFIPDGYSLK
jgi:hypothetical protein